MNEFLFLMGNLFMIACMQIVMDALISGKKYMLLSRVISIACYLGSFYLVLQFMAQYLLQEVSRMIQRLF